MPRLREQSGPSEEPILDAALAVVAELGIRRTTMIEVARRAGLSRMTVYRHFPDADALLRALMAREFGKTLDRAAASSEDAPDPRERAVAEIRHGVDELTSHPVVRRLLEVDAELLLPYFTERPGRFQQLTVARLAGLIAEGQQEGVVRDGDPQRLAATLELALRGAVLAAGPLAVGGRREKALADIADLADRYLRPP